MPTNRATVFAMQVGWVHRLQNYLNVMLQMDFVAHPVAAVSFFVPFIKRMRHGTHGAPYRIGSILHARTFVW